ncbi:ABC transporter substrate-binding protein [Bradyrhizobium sp. IC3195]|nr:ABC transporter substrate-binding protein [Bradyrhizobium sp. IC3195]
MKRREFLASVLGGAAASHFAPLSARAQQARLPIMGVLVLGTPPPESFINGLIDKLGALGYTNGRNIRIEIRAAEGNSDLLAAKAAELVQLNVDLVVAFQTLPATIAKQTTARIPIVMALVGDPVGTGLVDSLARPGRNVTGTSASAAEVAGKTVELIREVIPRARRFTVLANEADPFTRPFLAENVRAAQRVGMEVDAVTTLPGKALETTLSGIVGKQIDAVVL